MVVFPINGDNTWIVLPTFFVLLADDLDLDVQTEAASVEKLAGVTHTTLPRRYEENGQQCLKKQV